MFSTKNLYKIKFLAALLLSAAVFGLSLPAKVYAASVLIEFSTQDFLVEGEEVQLEIIFKGDAVVGEVNANFSYDSSRLEFVSGPGCVEAGDGVITIKDTGAGASNGEKTYLLSFLALKSGECDFHALDKPVVYSYTDNTRMAVSVIDKSIYIRSTAALSDNCNLKDMALYDLAGNSLRISPEFETDTFDYGAKVPFAITKVVVVATPEERHAEVSVAGEAGLQIGSNAVKVTIIAENGKRQTYTILVIREGLDVNQTDDNGVPIGITPTPTPTPEGYKDEQSEPTPMAGVNNQIVTPEPGVTIKSGTYGITVDEYHTYTAANAVGIKVPDGFTETKLYIDSIGIVAYESKDYPAELLLVPLKNEAGELQWYVYDRIEETFQRLNDSKVNYVTLKADYNEELLQTVEDYEKKQLQLLIISGVLAALCVILLALLVKNTFNRGNHE